MRKSAFVAVLVMAPVMFSAEDEKEKTIHRMREAGAVFSEIMGAPDKGIPHEILEKAQCIGIVPNMKRAGFIVGAKFGVGELVCRTANGWSAPETVIIEGGSIGFQIGAGETDLVFVVKNKTGEEHLMKDKFTIGGDASAMGGPVGRTAEAQTDAMMHAEILSWSRARGVFAGISLDGATLKPDKNANRAVYGRDVTPREILSGSVHHPAGAEALYSSLDQYSRGHMGRR
jgi:lipid-binding SYLF domain-containing protein